MGAEESWVQYFRCHWKAVLVLVFLFIYTVWILLT
jgi:hypothetical protein